MSTKRRNHKDLEFEVSSETRGRILTTHSPTKALVAAAQEAMQSGRSTLDVLTWTWAGARHYGGDDAVERYNEDPDASVFERFEFSANAMGRVP